MIYIVFASIRVKSHLPSWRKRFLWNRSSYHSRSSRYCSPRHCNCTSRCYLEKRSLTSNSRGSFKFLHLCWIISNKCPNGSYDPKGMFIYSILSIFQYLEINHQVDVYLIRSVAVMDIYLMRHEVVVDIHLKRPAVVVDV